MIENLKDEISTLNKTIKALKCGVVKRVLKDKLFCKNFTINGFWDHISIQCIEYPVHIDIFATYVKLTIDIVEDYHNDKNIMITLDEFIEDSIKCKCAEKYQYLIREKKLNRITDENY